MTDLPPSSSISGKPEQSSSGGTGNWEVQTPQPAQALEIKQPSPEQTDFPTQPAPVEQPPPEILPVQPPQPAVTPPPEAPPAPVKSTPPPETAPSLPVTTEDLGPDAQEAEEKGKQQTDPYAHLEGDIG